jgi:hypothetical protein
MRRHPVRRLAVTLSLTASSAALSLLALASCAEEAGTGGGGSPPAGAGGAGGTDVNGGSSFGGDTGDGGSATCMSTSAKAEPTPLDIVFMIDWSKHGVRRRVVRDHRRVANLLFGPAVDRHPGGHGLLSDDKPLTSEGPCDLDLFKVLDVPIAPLPENSFNLINAMPADAIGAPTPTHAGLGAR